MASKELTLAMRLLLDAQRFTTGLNVSGNAVNRFTGRVRSEFDRLRGTFNTVQGRLAQIGVSVGATALVVQSAKLDKGLSQIGLTAGASVGQIESLRNELFRLSKDSGKNIEDLLAGFNALVASGVPFDQALATMDGINRAMAISGANAEVLAQGVTVAARAFNFDLSNPSKANEILEKMTVGGRLGNAELEALAGVFGRVGNAAQRAGMQFDESLALVEALSLSLPGQPERLATRAESTLRLFTNQNYLKAAERASGVSFFDTAGARRESAAVFADLKARFDKFTTDADRAKFIQRAFGSADLDTQTGLFEILSGNNLAQMQEFQRRIQTSSGTFASDMSIAMDNSIDQVGRLKSTLRETADDFSRKLNEGISKSIKLLLDSREQGGLDLSGEQLIGAAAVGTGAALLAKRFGGPLLGRLFGSATDVATGVAAGKVLESAAGVTPVFVVNMPSNGFGTPAIGAAGAGAGASAAGAAARFGGWRAAAAIIAGTPLKNLATLGARGIAGAAGMVAGAGAAGYAAGKFIINPIIRAVDDRLLDGGGADRLGAIIAHALAMLGNDTAQEAVRQREQYEAMIKIELDDKRARVKQMQTSSPRVNLDVYSGRMFALQ